VEVVAVALLDPQPEVREKIHSSFLLAFVDTKPFHDQLFWALFADLSYLKHLPTTWLKKISYALRPSIMHQYNG